MKPGVAWRRAEADSIFRSPVLVALLVFGLVLPLLPTSADPGDVDAPDSYEDALLLTPGIISGNLSDSDPADWYALDVPQSSYAFIVLAARPNLPPTLVVVDENGAPVEYDQLWWGGWIGANVLPPASGTLRIGVLPSPYDDERYNYTLETRLVDRPEVVLSDLRVTPQLSAPTDVESATRRLITFNVTNEGPGPSSTEVFVTVTTPLDGQSTTILALPQALDAGAGATFSIEWDALLTGTIGDAVVTASAPTYFNIGNRETATAQTHGVVSGTGTGVTAGAGYTQICTSTFFAWTCTDWTIRPGYVRINHGDGVFGLRDSASLELTRAGVAACGSATWIGTCQGVGSTDGRGVGWQQVCAVWACAGWVVWAETAPTPGAGACVGGVLVGACRTLP